MIFSYLICHEVNNAKDWKILTIHSGCPVTSLGMLKIEKKYDYLLIERRKNSLQSIIGKFDHKTEVSRTVVNSLENQ